MVSRRTARQSLEDCGFELRGAYGYRTILIAWAQSQSSKCESIGRAARENRTGDAGGICSVETAALAMAFSGYQSPPCQALPIARSCRLLLDGWLTAFL